MTNSAPLPFFDITPGSRFDNFFKMHPESHYVWANIQSDETDLLKNVNTFKDKGMLQDAIEDIIKPFFIRTEMCVKDDSRTCGLRPLYGDLTRDTYNSTPENFSEMLSQKIPILLSSIKNDTDRKRLVLIDLFGYEQVHVTEEFFAAIKDLCRQFRAKPTYTQQDKVFFQILVAGSAK